MNCNECVFFFEIHVDVGQCRRYGPYPDRDKKRGSIDSEKSFCHFFGTNREWPQVSKKDFCGEFKKKPDGQEKV